MMVITAPPLVRFPHSRDTERLIRGGFAVVPGGLDKQYMRVPLSRWAESNF